ncbi:MAG TPA: phosphotransferase, partial [Candidatus Solibacter sp.]|nr:phosphotransferase [Candidatus Solibacter sp.]
ATPVTFTCNPALLRDVIELMQRLHGDTNLLSRLPTTAGKTCLDHFVETYIERFAIDLEGIGAAELPFISPALPDWMRSETLALREFAESRPVFREPAVSPVHSDLNETNVLVTPSGWHIIDWDDLAPGDPAIDLAVLLWPLVWQGRDWRDLVPRNESLRQRLEVCFRAQLLDEVIDPLSDYIDAHAAPSRMEEVRRVKRQRHEEALARYRAANS